VTQVAGFGDKVGFIWSVADLLRGDYKAREYGQVILPLTVRHTLNDDLFRMFFDKPEFQDALTTWARREVYRRIQDDLGSSA
jgi:type I restriction-modification system DNA methylase subunit